MARLMNVAVHIPAPWCHASHHGSMLGSMFKGIRIRGLPRDGSFFNGRWPSEKNVVIHYWLTRPKRDLIYDSMAKKSINLGKFHHDLTATSLESWLVREIIPFYGRKIQVSEIL